MVKFQPPSQKIISLDDHKQSACFTKKFNPFHLCHAHNHETIKCQRQQRVVSDQVKKLLEVHLLFFHVGKTGPSDAALNMIDRKI